MKNYQVNILYGLLTDGDNTIRKTTSSYDDLTPTGKKIVESLIPQGISAVGKRALAEIYIRLCQTDKVITKDLQHKDPLNTYKLWTSYEDFDLGDNFTMDSIVNAVKTLGLADEENSFLPVDYIRNALQKLIDTMRGV